MENREGHCLKWSPTVDYSKPKQLFSRRRWRLILLSNKFSIFLHELSPFHKHNTTRLCCICAFGCECIGVDCIKILISLFKRPTMLHWWCTYLSRGHKFEVPWAGHISSQEGFKFSFQLNLPNLLQIKPLSLPLSLSIVLSSSSLSLSLSFSHPKLQFQALHISRASATRNRVKNGGDSTEQLKCNLGNARMDEMRKKWF